MAFPAPLPLFQAFSCRHSSVTDSGAALQALYRAVLCKLPYTNIRSHVLIFILPKDCPSRSDAWTRTISLRRTIDGLLSMLTMRTKLQITSERTSKRAVVM